MEFPPNVALAFLDSHGRLTNLFFFPFSLEATHRVPKLLSWRFLIASLVARGGSLVPTGPDPRPTFTANSMTRLANGGKKDIHETFKVIARHGSSTIWMWCVANGLPFPPSVQPRAGFHSAYPVTRPGIVKLRKC